MLAGMGQNLEGFLPQRRNTGKNKP
jgi:hypothetical protein